MLSVVRLVWLVVRVRGMGIALAGGLLGAFLLALVPGGALQVPGRIGVYARVWPLIPAVSAASLPTFLHRHWLLSERISPARFIRHTGDILAFLLIQVTVLASCRWFSSVILVRNYLLAVGLVALGARILGRGAAWFPLVLLVTVTWLMGSGQDGMTESWALLLQERSSWVSGGVAALLIVVGTLALVIEPAPRGTFLGGGGDRAGRTFADR